MFWWWWGVLFICVVYLNLRTVALCNLPIASMVVLFAVKYLIQKVTVLKIARRPLFLSPCEARAIRYSSRWQKSAPIHKLSWRWHVVS